MGRLRAACLLAVALWPACAGNAADMTAKDKAYTLTLVCVVVAVNDKNEADHNRALDAARKMAKAKGYSEKRLTDDLFKTINVLGGELHDDPSAMDGNREICRRLKLIS